MELRTRVAIIVAGGAGALLLIVMGVFLWVKTHPQQPLPITPVSTEPITDVVPPPLPVSKDPVVVNPPLTVDPPIRPVVSTKTAEDYLKADLASIGFSFTERFGSYSNQGNYDNIDTLRFLMTRGMNSWADRYIAQLKVSPAPAPELYYGVSTRTLSTSLESFDATAGTATILVSTQRKETRGATSNSALIYQTLRLSFLKEDGIWKVESAQWGIKEPVSR